MSGRSWISHSIRSGLYGLRWQGARYPPTSFLQSRKRVEASVSNQPWDSALDAILQVNGLHAVETAPGTILVEKKPMP